MSTHHTPTTTPPRSGAGTIILKTIFSILILVAVVSLWRGWKKAEEAQQKKADTVVRTVEPRTADALVLQAECMTPCSANIAWRFKIRTEGHPLDIKFQGVANPVHYPGEGDFDAPTQMQSGETKFVSSDKAHPNIRVQVYRIVITPIRY